MGTAVDLRILAYQAQVGFIDQGGALQGVPRTFAIEVIVRETAKLVVDQRDQSVEGLAVSLAPVGEKLRDLTRNSLRHRSNPFLRRPLPAGE
jgi:hypothetical protein